MIINRVWDFLLKLLNSLTRTATGTWRQIRESEMQILAGALAFTTVLSLVPLLAVSLSVFKAYGGFDGLAAKIEPFIMRNFVEASGAEATRFIKKSIGRIHSGTLGISGAIALLLISTKLFHDMEMAVQRVFRVKSQRRLPFRLLIYWVVMFLGPLVLAIALGVLGSKDLGLIRLLPKGAISIAVSFTALLLIYKFVPAVKVRWKSALISAFIAAAGIGMAQAFYASITQNILRYSKIYGSLASVPIFLIWILVLWWVVLAGVALCATLEKQKRS